MSLALLERLAASVGWPLDRSAALVSLREAADQHPGTDPDASLDRLIWAGARLGLRIRTVRGNLDELRSWLKETGCVAAPTRQKGVAGWLLVTRCSRKEFLVEEATPEARPTWISASELQLRISDAEGSAQWLAVEAEAPWEGSSRGTESGLSAEHGSHGGLGHASRFTPFRRLLALMRAERRDIHVILVFALFVGLLTLATPIAVEALVNTVAFGGLIQPLVVLATILFCFLSFSSMARGLQTYVVELMQRRVFVRVVADLAHRLPRVRSEGLDGVHGPELVNRFFDVVTVQKVLSLLLLDGVGIVLQAVVGMIVLAFYHPALLAFDVALLFLIVVVVFVFGFGAVRTSINESRAKYALAGWLEQVIGLEGVFRSSAGSELARGRADHLAAIYLRERQSHFQVVMRQIIGALTLQALAATGLLGLGGWLVMSGQLTLGQLVAAELIVSAIVSSFAKLGKHLDAFYDLLTALDKIGHLFDLPVDSGQGDRRPGRGPATVHGRSVGYTLAGHALLEGLHFEIQPGERCGLTGAAGSGKSMLLELLAGWRTATSGQIELDGQDVRSWHMDSWREQVALVRNGETFTGTIWENVQAHRPEISSDMVHQALQSVGLWKEIQGLPEGCNTPLSVGGAPLSGSQIVRLTLARALCGSPRLLLIDGLLDSLSGDAWQASLSAVLDQGRSWTLLVVSAREELLTRCDRRIDLTATSSHA